MAAPSKRVPMPRRPRKRRDGEGTIYQRKDGLWIGELMIGFKNDGRRDVRAVSAKTQAEACERLDALRRLVQQDQLPEPHKLTVGDLLNQWLEDCVTRGLRPKTLAGYRQIVRCYLMPEVGSVKAREIRPEHVRRLLAVLVKRRLSAATVRAAFTALHAALRLAVHMELVGRNVADAVRPPKRVGALFTPPTPEQSASLLNAAASTNDRLAALWSLGVYSGCRPGELLALRWEDVNLDAGLIVIRRNLTKVNGAPPEFVDPKTARGRRSVTLPREAVTTLRAHRRRQDEERVRLGADYRDQGLVFATQTGAPLIPRDVVRAFKRLLVHAGLPAAIRWYDLRHGHATALLVAGVHPKVASERLGHSSVTLTLDTYSHVLEGMDADAAMKVQQAIRGADDEAPREPTDDEHA
jgi:integrase